MESFREYKQKEKKGLIMEVPFVRLPIECKEILLAEFPYKETLNYLKKRRNYHE